MLVREERLAWALIGVALIAWSGADLYYSLVLAKLDEPPFPSISDAGWLFFYPAFWAAVVLLMRRRIREFHASLWLDGIVGALGMAACVAALVLPPILAMSVQGEAAAVAVNLAYPVRRPAAARAAGRRAGADGLATGPVDHAAGRRRAPERGGRPELSRRGRARGLRRAGLGGLAVAGVGAG